MLKYILPFLAAFGLLFGIYVVRLGAKEMPAAQPVAEPSAPPFAHYIAGAGITEASTENIEISTPLAGLVTEIPVKIGQDVKAGDVLFKLDARDLEAELKVRQAALELSKVKIPEADANLGDMKRQLELYQAVSDPRAITQEEFSKRKFAVAGSEARARQAQVEQMSAEAMVSQTQMDIERRIIRAPVTGQVLQVKVHLGEYAQVGQLATPLMVLGETKQINIRTDIDENDAWRFNPTSKAIAYVRGNPKLHTELKFVRVEPYVVPKKSLTGDTTERVDTRVLQVLYGFPHEQLDMYVGQQMDVYIEAPDISGKQTTASAVAAGPKSAAD